MNFGSSKIVFNPWILLPQENPVYLIVTSILVAGWPWGLPSEPTWLGFQMVFSVATSGYLHLNRRSDHVDRMSWRAQAGKFYCWWTDLNKQRRIVMQLRRYPISHVVDAHRIYRKTYECIPIQIHTKRYKHVQQLHQTNVYSQFTNSISMWGQALQVLSFWGWS